MSKPVTEHRQGQSAGNATKLSTATRIDAPHPAGQQEPPKTAAEAVAGQLCTQTTQLASHLRARQKELDRRESQLNAQLAHLERDARAARLWLREREAELSHRREELAGLENQRQAVQRRSERVDQSQAALEQLRAELSRMHRETLEIRLATEELRVQLSGAAPPAVMTRSLGRIRSKLADQYRLANAELHSQKQELENIRAQLSEQYKKLKTQLSQPDKAVALPTI